LRKTVWKQKAIQQAKQALFLAKYALQKQENAESVTAQTSTPAEEANS